MDSERARALRDLLGGSDWVQRTREFAVTLRRSTTPGGLLLVGTPDEEPWHLAAHLDDESRYSGTAENYQETLNHALDRAMIRLLGDPGFQRNICSCGG